MNKLQKRITSLLLALVCAVALVAVCLLSGCNSSRKHVKPEEGGGETPPTVKGELDMKLVRTRLETRTLDMRGYPKTHDDAEKKDFSSSKENIFGLRSDLLIGPGCYFSAEMELTNRKPFGFIYWIEILPEKGLLAEQMELTVTIGDETLVKRTLDEGLVTQAFPPVESGKTAAFTVRLEYLDTDENDETMNTTMRFDMAVCVRLT